MTLLECLDDVKGSRRNNIKLVSAAVHRHPLLSRAGLTERLFTLSFSGLVYPQIWEDPRVDIEALALAPGQRMVTIASGGCNVLSYLTAAQIEITAVDLNAAHIALNKLKIAAARHLTSWADFHRFFGQADSQQNIAIFDDQISPHLDPVTRAYWHKRDWRGRRRIEGFARGFYRSGLLGRFISSGHLAARLFGANPKAMLEAKTLEQQREIFDSELRPLFEKRIVRWVLDGPSALFGLGIPPAQYAALAGGRPMHDVILERLERLACDYPLHDNYFAWQAFGQSYARGRNAALPPYLEAQNFETVQSAHKHVRYLNVPFTRHLETQPARSIDRYVLLDAQDWMPSGDLNALWREITRTARTGARVIFRTAGRDTILPGEVHERTLSQWVYHRDLSLALTAKDRSAIYGGFHLYERAG